MANAAIDRDTVHTLSEACAEDGERFRAIATRLLKEQKRLLSFYNQNLPAIDAQTGEVSLYLFSVVVRIFDQMGGRLSKVNGKQINAAAAKVQGVVDQLLPFDKEFPERVRAIEDRAQPHILDEALWALFERSDEDKQEGEVDVDPTKAGMIFMMLWVATEALDAAWKPPASFGA
ncbi:MAG: hypothetical protein VX899_27005 [Myxococcota bacterium]|nr:hypothetical protein [Myxococcota bacterium]